MGAIYYYQAKFYSTLVNELIQVTDAYATPEALEACLRANVETLATRVIEFYENVFEHLEELIAFYVNDISEIDEKDRNEYDFDTKMMRQWIEELIEHGVVQTGLVHAYFVQKPFLAEYVPDPAG